MEFDRSKVYTALNADELKIGSKVIVANAIGNLKQLVEQNMIELSDLTRINDIYSLKRFIVNESTDRVKDFAFAYLVSEPEVKKLKWTDLKIGDIVTNGTRTYMITGIDSMGKYGSHILFGGDWITDEELENWEKVE